MIKTETYLGSVTGMNRNRITLAQTNLRLSNWKLKPKSDENQASVICKAKETLLPFVKRVLLFFLGKYGF